MAQITEQLLFSLFMADTHIYLLSLAKRFQRRISLKMVYDDGGGIDIPKLTIEPSAQVAEQEDLGLVFIR